jgi:5'-3' exonuclease
LVREQLYVLRSWNKKSVFVTSQTIEEEFGIPSVSWAQLRALTGDDSDTIIKAKKGVGPKTAAKLLIGGLNPANPRFEDHNQKVVAKFSEAWKNLWPQVHQNYLLSKILTYENFSSNGFLDIETRAKVESLAKAQKSDLLGKRDEDNWDVMEEFLIRYEMHDFWESRREIWRLNETSTP